MAPSKNSDKPSPTAFESRVAALHSHLLSTLTAHTLKDLEKALPSAVPGITGMNAKDHIQALVDENLLRVEKIGTGNWYWCFGSDLRREKEHMKEAASSEADTVEARVHALRVEVQEEQNARVPDEDGEETDKERGQLMQEVTKLEANIAVLKKDLAKHQDSDPTVLEAKQLQIRTLRDEAEIWTENCWVLESYMRDNLRVSKEDSMDLLRECYGDQFVEEDGGLTEIS